MNVKEQIIWQKKPPEDEGIAFTPKLEKGYSARKNHFNIRERNLLTRSRTSNINQLGMGVRDNEISF